MDKYTTHVINCNEIISLHLHNIILRSCVIENKKVIIVRSNHACLTFSVRRLNGLLVDLLTNSPLRFCPTSSNRRTY